MDTITNKDEEGGADKVVPMETSESASSNRGEEAAGPGGDEETLVSLTNRGLVVSEPTIPGTPSGSTSVGPTGPEDNNTKKKN